MRQSLGGRAELPCDWENITEAVRESVKKTLVYCLDRGKKTRRFVGGMKKCKVRQKARASILISVSSANQYKSL